MTSGAPILVAVQSGGPTAVINATLAAALAAASRSGRYGRILGSHHSYEGLAKGDFVDLTDQARDRAWLTQLTATPGAILGSSRKPAAIERSVQQLAALGRPVDLLLIGGNGTSQAGKLLGGEIEKAGLDARVVVAPKTMDNDLNDAAFAPGYLSAAQATATIARDIGADHRTMKTFDAVTVLETLGRDSGWLALAASAFASWSDDGSDHPVPHITLIPEMSFDEDLLFDRIERVRSERGYAVIAMGETLTQADGTSYGAAEIRGPRDDLGRPVYSLSTGTGMFLASRIRTKLGLQTRTVRPGTVLRSASGLRATKDVTLAEAAGARAVELFLSGAFQGGSSLFLTISERLEVGVQPLDRVDSRARKVPAEAFNVTALAPNAAFLHQLSGHLDLPEPILLSI